MRTLTKNFALGAALLMPAALIAQTTYTEGLINFPGSALLQASGIDDNDQVAGSFENPASNQIHGFVLSHGVAAQVDFPGVPGTALRAINSTRGIAGDYLNGQGQFSIIDAQRRFRGIKGSFDKTISAMNSAGSFVGTDQNLMGFINVGGVYTAVDPGPCKAISAVGIYITGINSLGDMVGHCFNNAAEQLGFSIIGGNEQIVTVFGQVGFPMGINDNGTIAGYFLDGSNVYHGFLLSGGTPTQFDFAGNAAGTMLVGINNKGSLAGNTLEQVQGGEWLGFFAFAN
jgi:hypothetical protein